MHIFLSLTVILLSGAIIHVLTLALLQPGFDTRRRYVVTRSDRTGGFP